MKLMISFLSILIIVAGALHFFENLPIPTKGTGYSIVLLVMGILILAASFMNQLLLGFERFFLVIQSAALIFVAILPFFGAILPFLPREGLSYSALVILIGIAGLAYGVTGMG